MADPDARYPENPTLRWILHWLQTDLATAPQGEDGTTRLVNSTAAIAPYRGPAPPTNSSAHRYILYAFRQPDNFVIPAAFQGFNSTNRTMFPLEDFLDQSNLGQTPAAAMYYYASNNTGVPATFSAAAGATYPGGNGQMITEGPGPSVTAPPSATASATGSAMTSTFTGGAARLRPGWGIF
jgi:phosphatidylethanolamine-binding protein